MELYAQMIGHEPVKVQNLKMSVLEAIYLLLDREIYRLAKESSNEKATEVLYQLRSLITNFQGHLDYSDFVTKNIVKNEDRIAYGIKEENYPILNSYYTYSLEGFIKAEKSRYFSTLAGNVIKAFEKWINDIKIEHSLTLVIFLRRVDFQSGLNLLLLQAYEAKN